MSTSEVVLHGFAYGEDLDTFGQRSLGYRLLAPAGGVSWGQEVESLARQLQMAPYPDHWPTVDLFCSVLLTDRQRLIAVARYGLVDHTPDQRRGGLELVGVVTPNILPIPEILAIYRWLRQRRACADDLHSLGGPTAFSEIVKMELCSAPAPSPGSPVRISPNGLTLLEALSPDHPDRHLHLLELHPHTAWQWLPLVGSNFPLQHQARLGPLVAWTPRPNALPVSAASPPS